MYNVTKEFAIYSQLAHTTLAALLLLCASCSRPIEPTTMKVYQAGNEYTILDRGETFDEGLPAYFVRFYSENPADDAVLAAECKDLYVIIAKHIDTNKHQRVVIEAVEQKGRFFGIMKPREVRLSSSVADVLAYQLENSNPAAK